MALNSKAIVPLVVWAALAVHGWLLGTPLGLAPHAWSYFAIFAAVIVGLVLEPIPAPVIGVIGVAATTIRDSTRSSQRCCSWRCSSFNAFLRGSAHRRLRCS